MHNFTYLPTWKFIENVEISSCSEITFKYQRFVTHILGINQILQVQEIAKLW